MADRQTLQHHVPVKTDFMTTHALNLYDSAACQTLATQAQVGRYLRILAYPDLDESSLQVVLVEDDYPGWIKVEDLHTLRTASSPYQPNSLTPAEIQSRIPGAIAFARAAMTQPNIYLWGGTLGPDYDCSGLVQHAFAAQGIRLPRDAYQQEAFTQPLNHPGAPEAWVEILQPGDLIFFGTPQKATHVAIYLGEGRYIHSSGKDQGRNGIGIDVLSMAGEPVSQTYYAQFRGAGRVVRCYQPGEEPWKTLNP
jgi:cell wall-associated NlpC family hydrolase